MHPSYTRSLFKPVYPVSPLAYHCINPNYPQKDLTLYPVLTITKQSPDFHKYRKSDHFKAVFA